MSPIPNPKVVFAKIPEHHPIPNEHLIYDANSDTIDLESVPLNGGILAKLLYISVDPALNRILQNPNQTGFPIKFTLGEPGMATSVLKVIRSENEKYKAGDHIDALMAEWRLYQIIPPPAFPTVSVISNPANLPWSHFVSVAGTAAQTAFYGMNTYSRMKAGETIFVSTAAGAVGSTVVQLAKLAGLKVIGSTGDDTKVKYLKEELGVDVAFNYKTTSVWDVLSEHGPIDIYYDNVGGEQLDAALGAARVGARFIICGYMSQHNAAPGTEPYRLKNGYAILKSSIQVTGFRLLQQLATQGLQPWNEHYLPLVKEGKIKMAEHRSVGLETFAQNLVDVLEGKSIGKGVVVVAED